MYRHGALLCVISFSIYLSAADEGVGKRERPSTAPLLIPGKQNKNVPMILQNSPRSASPKLLLFTTYSLMGGGIGMKDNSPTTPSTY